MSDAPTGPAYTYRAYCERLVDADTAVFRTDLGYGVALSVMGRLQGVDAPERGTVEGEAAHQFVHGLLRPADLAHDDPLVPPRACLIRSYHDRRSFARWIVEVWYRTDVGEWQSLADALRDAGHVKR